MSTPDATLVLTAHSETVVSGPTMRSADIAVAAARAEGFTVQCVIALDAVSPATLRYFTQSRFDHWERWSFDEKELGRVRNAAISRSQGRFIAFLDADDLFSENWLAEGLIRLERAERDGERVIAHPELNVLFDGTDSIMRKLDQDSPLFSPHLFYVRNYYDSLCLAPREAHLKSPYSTRDIPNGVAFQDWQFAIETMDAGWKHVVVPDTIIFKRRRDQSLVRESSNRRAIVRALPAMAIDRVRSLASPTVSSPPERDR